MATRSVHATPAPGEELIGTITASGVRLTREAWRAQRAYRSKQARAQAAPRRGLMSWLIGKKSLRGNRPRSPSPAHRSREGG